LPRGQCASAYAKVKQLKSVIGWVTKNLLFRVPPCSGRHVKLLVPAAFAVGSTHQPELSLCVILKERLCPTSRDINMTMMMMMMSEMAARGNILYASAILPGIK
jgi:hypothetical protein